MTRPDVLVAGAPCQGHSDLNNHTRRRDPRNQLYLRSVRAVQVLEPAFVVLENVPTVRHDSSGVVDVAQEELQASGYRTATAVVNLGNSGFPSAAGDICRWQPVSGERTQRHSSSWSRRAITPPAACAGPLGTLPASRRLRDSTPAARTSPVNQKRITWLFDNAAYDLPNRLRPECHWGEHSYAAMYGRLRWALPAQTITTGFGSMEQGRYVHPSQHRTLTPHEAVATPDVPRFLRLR